MELERGMVIESFIHLERVNNLKVLYNTTRCNKKYRTTRYASRIGVFNGIFAFNQSKTVCHLLNTLYLVHFVSFLYAT